MKHNYFKPLSKLVCIDSFDLMATSNLGISSDQITDDGKLGARDGNSIFDAEEEEW